MIKNITFKTAAAAFVLAALPAVSAFANDSVYPGTTSAGTAVSSMTRAEVRADYVQAQRDGTVMQGDHNYPTAIASSQATGGMTRAQVRAELAAADARGQSMVITNSNFPGEFVGS